MSNEKSMVGMCDEPTRTATCEIPLSDEAYKPMATTSIFHRTLAHCSRMETTHRTTMYAISNASVILAMSTWLECIF